VREARTHLLKYCDRVTLTRATVLEGAGTDDDPMRDVEYWYDDDGIQIARRDVVEETERLKARLDEQ
jgi:hypothetical protein